MDVLLTVFLWLVGIVVLLFAFLVFAIRIGNKAGFEMREMFRAQIDKKGKEK